MKVRYSFISISLLGCLILIFLSSCKKDKEKISTLTIHKEVKNNWDNLPSLVAQKMDISLYDSLNLNNLNFIPPYEYADFVIDILSSNDSLESRIGILTVINSGEILSYLMTYHQNVLVDDLMVYYEDNVEYYQHITSTINNDSICITSVTWKDDFDNYRNNSDTTIENYLLTPTLQFEKIN